MGGKSSFLTPGVLFINSGAEFGFHTRMFAHAREAGYTRFVEPACGSLTMSHFAQQGGWDSAAMEASDVSLFSAVMGYAVMGKTLEDLQVQIDGFEEEDLTDPATVMWAEAICRAETRADRVYWAEVARAMRLDRTRHLDDLNRQLDRARQTLGGLTFTCRDLFDHLDAVADDPKTLVSLNPPTITAGYETFYNTDGRVRWHQPPYEVFDPVEGHARLEQYLARNALLSIYVERPQTDRAVMARGSFRKGPGDTGVARSMNWYITSNRPDELRDYLGGFLVVPWDGYAVARGDYQIVQPDHVITSDSTVQIVPMRDEQANYYRLLWTHRFVGAHARINLAMLVDGYLAGVFGYDPAYLSSAGAYGKDANALAIIYGMTPHYTARRLNRLLSRLALTRDAIRLVLSSVMLSRCEMLVTAQMSPYPESKEYRGIMTLEKRKKDPVHGYRLIYTAPIVEQSWPDVFATWIKDEDRWRNARAKHRAAQAAHSSV